MIRKTVEFATPGTRLSVVLKQLVVERPDMPKPTLPIEDLGIVIVDDARAIYTQAVFLELLAAGATVMVTGRDHLPAGMMLPLDAHHVQTERHRAQVEAGGSDQEADLAGADQREDRPARGGAPSLPWRAFRSNAASKTCAFGRSG